MVAALLALGATIALAVIGVSPQGGHTWLSIQNALSAAADHLKPTGGHTWL